MNIVYLLDTIFAAHVREMIFQVRYTEINNASITIKLWIAVLYRMNIISKTNYEIKNSSVHITSYNYFPHLNLT